MKVGILKEKNDDFFILPQNYSPRCEKIKIAEFVALLRTKIK